MLIQPYKFQRMPNTYTQIHIQYVFAVKNKAALIDRSWKGELEKYITGIVQNHGHKMLQINCQSDHVHLLIGLRPIHSVSAIAQKIKVESSLWIKEQKLCKSPFYWQEGYGAFSYDKSQVADVIRYIQNQEIHHRKESFLNEYKRFLKAFEIDWEEKYIFAEPV
jgi:REP element-mobilizing transposase RayT